jgi:hypothetical protein
MELAIPIESFQYKDVTYDASTISTKSILSFHYSDKENSVEVSDIILLLPPTRVISYQSATGKLILDMKEHSAQQAILRAFQDSVQTYISKNYQTWFPTLSFSSEQLDIYFQKCISQNVLILYCPSSDADGQVSSKPTIPTYRQGSWQQRLKGTDLVAGGTVRLAMRLTGVSFHLENGTWSGKYRVQHKIHALYIRD